MITAWEVYWVMQLDSIFVGFMILSVIFGLGALIAWMVYMVEGYHTLPMAKKLATGFLCFLSLSVLTPSSKTAATMIILPALTSDQVMEPVGREAKEIYDLAKKALKRIAEDKK